MHTKHTMYLHFVINGRYTRVPSFFCSDAGTGITRPLLRRLRAACLCVAEPVEQPFGGQQGGIPILRHHVHLRDPTSVAHLSHVFAP